MPPKAPPVTVVQPSRWMDRDKFVERMVRVHGFTWALAGAAWSGLLQNPNVPKRINNSTQRLECLVPDS